MAGQESIQRRIERVRPPRVQLTYDVQVGESIERRQIPFVVGVIGDFAGQPDPQTVPTRLRDRKFVEIDRESFDGVMRGIGPRLSFEVSGLSPDRPTRVALNFDALADFRPEAVVRQVPALAKLAALRSRLADLRNALAGNERLDDVLTDVLAHPDRLALSHDASMTGAAGEGQRDDGGQA